MAILPIVICGEPVLHRPAEPVTEFDEALRILVDDMFETCEAAPGVGLAAPQVGVGKRLFVWMYEDQDEAPVRGVAINPELWLSPPEPGLPGEDEIEGCLSFPGERFALRRSRVRCCARRTPTAPPSRSRRADGSRAFCSTSSTI